MVISAPGGAGPTDVEVTLDAVPQGASDSGLCDLAPRRPEKVNHLGIPSNPNAQFLVLQFLDAGRFVSPLVVYLHRL